MRSISFSAATVVFWTAVATFTFVEFGVVVTGIIAAALVGRDVIGARRRRRALRP
jgi:Flp pilus assembly protein TadB